MRSSYKQMLQNSYSYQWLVAGGWWLEEEFHSASQCVTIHSH
ncbi:MULTISPECIES: hypothetical protein [Chroococcidiopsis]|nr:MULTISPECIES: hypothetical protein [Chroococcidiopsis]